MNRQIKLLWEFRGPNAAKTAEHHVIHLKEYIAIEKLQLNITGFQSTNEFQATAYMVIEEAEMNRVRKALKPHRGQVYKQE